MRTIDLVTVVGLAVLSGLVFGAWNSLYYVAQAVLGPVFWAVMYGGWFIGATIPAYIVRKPGAALLGELIAAMVEILTGSPFSSTLVAYGIGQGILAEAVFAIGRYRRWGYVTMALAGAAPAIFAVPADYLLYYQGVYSADQIPVLFSLYFISGAIIAGILVKFAFDRIARTGVLDAFPVSRLAPRSGP